jgi:predicted RNase H-like HicB family nuclease
MSTLIAVYNSSGCVGRCDAKCYEASCPDCDCICGGANHGAGKEKAIENTREMVDGWVEEYAERKGLSEFKTHMNRNLVDQFSLFSFSHRLRAGES